MVLSPLNPAEVAEAFPGGRGALDLLDAYLVTGGYPRLVDRARRHATAAFERDWSTWRGKAVEPVVHEAVGRLARCEPALAGVGTVGGWWDRKASHEVDVVGAAGDGTVLVVGTVKWRARRAVTAAEVHELAETRAALPRAGGARLAAVCPAGVRSGVEADFVLEADAVLAAFAP